jgi:hypothetical protein
MRGGQAAADDRNLARDLEKEVDFGSKVILAVLLELCRIHANIAIPTAWKRTRNVMLPVIGLAPCHRWKRRQPPASHCRAYGGGLTS